MEEKYIEQIKENEQRSKSNTYRLNKLEQDNKILHEMNKNIAIMAEQNKYQNEKIDKIEIDVKELKKTKAEVTIENDVKEIKEKPSKRYDLIVTTLITALITVIVTLVVTSFF